MGTVFYWSEWLHHETLILYSELLITHDSQLIFFFLLHGFHCLMIHKLLLTTEIKVTRIQTITISSLSSATLQFCFKYRQLHVFCPLRNQIQGDMILETLAEFGHDKNHEKSCFHIKLKTWLKTLPSSVSFLFYHTSLTVKLGKNFKRYCKAWFPYEKNDHRLITDLSETKMLKWPPNGPWPIADIWDTVPDIVHWRKCSCSFTNLNQNLFHLKGNMAAVIT